MSKTPYKRGAEDGLKFGVYLAVLFFAAIFSDKIPLAGLLSFLLAVGVPVIIYRMMVSYKRELGGVVTFSMLWMQGLMIFACGGVIAGGLLLVYMRWINPDFMADQLRQLAELDTSGMMAGFNESKELAQNMIDSNFVPRAIDMVLQIILLGIASGSFLSMFLAGIIMARLKYKENNILKKN